MEEYTISGCMKDVTSQHSGASPVYSEKDMTYCTQFWRDGACTRGEVSPVNHNIICCDSL